MNLPSFSFFAFLGALGVLAVPIEAQEWTRFRGPNGTGISKAATVPARITEADINWRVELPGIGHSSPVVWGRKIFVTGAEDSQGKRHILCLNAADGKRLWTKTYDFAPYHHHEFNSSASATPFVDAQRVYVTWATPNAFTVLALDHSGKELWRRDLGKLAIQHGSAASPIVVGDVLILNVDQEQEGVEAFVAGLDCKTGAVRWKRPRKIVPSNSPYSTPMVYTPAGGAPEVLFSSASHGLTSLDPKTGAVNWEVPNLFHTRCVGSPVMANGLIFATGGVGNGDKEAVAVRPPTKKGSAALAFRLKRGPVYVPTPIAVGDRVFFWGDGGIVTCVRADNGETVWQERVGGNFFGSPICVNGKLYALSTKGELVVISASDRLEILSRYDLGEATHATPAVAEGVLYLRTQSHLISIGGKKTASR